MPQNFKLKQPKLFELNEFRWGIPNKINKQDYTSELNRMWRKLGSASKNQDVNQVCLALQVLVTLEQAHRSNQELHRTAMRVIFLNTNHLDTALAKIHDELLQDNKNEYLTVLKKIGAYYKDTDFLPQAIERLKAKNLLEQNDLYKEALDIIQKSRELVVLRLPSKNEEFDSLEVRIFAMSQCDAEAALDNVETYHRNAKILHQDVTAAIHQAKAKREAIAALLPFPCELVDHCMKFTITVLNHSYSISYNSIERLGNQDNIFIAHEILRYICENLMAEYKNFIAENNLSSTHIFSKATEGLVSLVHASDNSPGRILYIGRYLKSLLATEKIVTLYDDVVKKIKKDTNNFLLELTHLEKAKKAPKDFMIERAALAEKFAIEIFSTLSQLQPSSGKTLQLIDLVFNKSFKRPYIFNAMTYDSLQNLATMAWGMVEQDLQVLQSKIFDNIMFATIGKNDNTSPHPDEQGLAAVCISLQYLAVIAGGTHLKIRVNAMKIIDTHHELLNVALWKIHDALPSPAQKQIFMQRLKIVANRFDEGAVKDQLLQFSAPNSLLQYSTAQVTNNSVAASPSSHRSGDSATNDPQADNKKMEELLPQNILSAQY